MCCVMRLSSNLVSWQSLFWVMAMAPLTPGPVEPLRSRWCSLSLLFVWSPCTWNCSRSGEFNIPMWQKVSWPWYTMMFDEFSCQQMVEGEPGSFIFGHLCSFFSFAFCLFCRGFIAKVIDFGMMCHFNNVTCSVPSEIVWRLEWPTLHIFQNRCSFKWPGGHRSTRRF